MENSTNDQSLFDINFDDNVKQSLRGTAVWGGMAAILSLVSAVLGIINYFVQKSKINDTFPGFGDLQTRQAEQAGGLVSSLISLIIGFILFFFLFKFSRSVKAGVDANDSYLINEGLGSLSTYFKFMGVLVIIVLVLFGLGMLIGIGSGI